MAWVFDRASGEIALVLAAVVAVVGVLPSGGLRLPGWTRTLMVTLHRRAALAMFVFLGLHFVTALVDPFQNFDLAQLVVPGLSRYRALFMGMGTAGMELLLAVSISSLGRRWTSRRWWRPLHWLAYPAFALGWVHAAGAGSDATRPLFIAVQALTGLVVVGALAWRLYVAVPEPWPLVVVGGGALMVLVAVGWLVRGPLSPGWRALERTDSADLTPVGGSRGWWPREFSDQVTADRSVTAVTDVGAVEVRVRASGDLVLVGTIQAAGPLAADGHVDLANAPFTLAGADGTTVCSGQVSRLDRDGFDAVCTGRVARVTIHAAWSENGDQLVGNLKGEAVPDAGR